MEAVQQAAKRAHLTSANYLRRCVNEALAREGRPERLAEMDDWHGRCRVMVPDVRKRVRYLRSAGLTMREIAERVGVSKTHVHHVLQEEAADLL